MRLEAAWGSLGEPGGGWGLENVGFLLVFEGFCEIMEAEEKTTTTKKIKVIGTEGVGARPAWGEPGSLGARELGSWGAWRTPEEAGGNLGESRGAWGRLGARKYWFFIGFYWFSPALQVGVVRF